MEGVSLGGSMIFWADAGKCTSSVRIRTRRMLPIMPDRFLLQRHFHLGTVGGTGRHYKVREPRGRVRRNSKVDLVYTHETRRQSRVLHLANQVRDRHLHVAE